MSPCVLLGKLFSLTGDRAKLGHGLMLPPKKGGTGGRLQVCVRHILRKPQMYVFCPRQKGRKPMTSVMASADSSVFCSPDKMGTLHDTLEPMGEARVCFLGCNHCICLFPFGVLYVRCHWGGPPNQFAVCSGPWAGPIRLERI